MIAPSSPCDRRGRFAAAYDELRRLARARLRRGPRATLLDTTVLVHEAWLRIDHAYGHADGHADGQAHGPVADDRADFFAYAASVMRSVIVDAARARTAARRGGPAERLPFDEARDLPADDGAAEVLRVHQALEVLATHDARLVRVVELRYFGGMTEAQVAQVLGVAERTVRRDWEKARLLLAEALT
jgi:RNA polymerase sigma factor (TIGR02999 family)